MNLLSFINNCIETHPTFEWLNITHLDTDTFFSTHNNLDKNIKSILSEMIFDSDDSDDSDKNSDNDNEKTLDQLFDFDKALPFLNTTYIDEFYSKGLHILKHNRNRVENNAILHILFISLKDSNNDSYKEYKVIIDYVVVRGEI